MGACWSKPCGKYIRNSPPSRLEGHQVTLDDFDVIKMIGEGAFYKVFIVRKKSTHDLFALKFIPKDSIENAQISGLLRERKFLQLLCPFPYLVNMRYAFQNEDTVCMVVDLMLGGDLRFYLHHIYNIHTNSILRKKNLRMNKKRHESFNRIHGSNDGGTNTSRMFTMTKLKVPEMVLSHFIAQCCIAIHYIHTNGVIHRDIKPENLLLDAFGFLHLSDFNVSCTIPEDGYKLKSRAGTLAYMAPEMLRKTGYRSSVDWWSLGVLMYELMFGRLPFVGTTKEDMIRSILKGEYPIVIGKYSDPCVEFLKSLLKMNPKRRAGFEDGHHGDDGARSSSHSHKDNKGPEHDHMSIPCLCYISRNSQSTFQKIMQDNFFRGIDWVMMCSKKIKNPYHPNPSKLHFDMTKNNTNHRTLLHDAKKENCSVTDQRPGVVQIEFPDYNWEHC